MKCAVVVVVVVVVAGMMGCATSPPAPPPPVISLKVDDVGAKGEACGGPIEVRRGPRPVEARVISVLRVEADRPVSLEALEQVLEVAARRRCAEGLAVTKASADDGASGYLDASAEAWSSTAAPAAVTPAP